MTTIRDHAATDTHLLPLTSFRQRPCRFRGFEGGGSRARVVGPPVIVGEGLDPAFAQALELLQAGLQASPEVAGYRARRPIVPAFGGLGHGGCGDGMPAQPTPTAPNCFR